jgi:phage FluMu protein Com
MPRKLTREEFILKAKEVHGNKYDYKDVVYKNNRIQVNILCTECEEVFKQRPIDHLQGNGCPPCNGTKKLTLEQFIQKAREVHEEKYEYKDVVYKNNYTPVNIWCTFCNKIFLQRPKPHLLGQGCPNCSSFKSEKICRDYLNEICEYDFVKCHPTFLEGMELDGFCVEMNIAFEYNGIQHYEFRPFFHRNGEQDFVEQQERDKLKLELCAKQGVDLIVVPYEYDFRNEKRLKQYVKVEYEKIILKRYG